MNPLVPAVSDLLWSGLAVVAVALAVWALVSLAGRAARLSSSAVLLWVLVILLAPVLGPVAWLVAGRRAGSELTRT